MVPHGLIEIYLQLRFRHGKSCCLRGCRRLGDGVNPNVFNQQTENERKYCNTTTETVQFYIRLIRRHDGNGIVPHSSDTSSLTPSVQSSFTDIACNERSILSMKSRDTPEMKCIQINELFIIDELINNFRCQTLHTPTHTHTRTLKTQHCRLQCIQACSQSKINRFHEYITYVLTFQQSGQQLQNRVD